MAYRTSDEIVADLEAKILAVKLRTELKAARKNPVVKEAVIAVKAIDRAIAAGAVEPMRGGLVEARQTLAQVVASLGLRLPSPNAVASEAPRKRKAKTAS